MANLSRVSVETAPGHADAMYRIDHGADLRLTLMRKRFRSAVRSFLTLGQLGGCSFAGGLITHVLRRSGEMGESFVVVDSTGQPLSYVYFEPIQRTRPAVQS
jgi:hypothetical protein